MLGPARPSRSLALTGDTGPAASVVEAATGVDLLVHEATFCADERQRARETNHSTAAEAALAAQGGGRRAARADAPLEPATSARRSAEEARQVFPATVVPRDFDVIEIPFAERGEPVLVPRGARRSRGPAHASARGVSAADTPDFGARARVYDTLRPTDAAWWEAFAALVELGDLRGRRVLDVGCGTGRLLAALVSEAHAKAWGIDASAEMVAVARETLPAGVGVRRGDGRAAAVPRRVVRPGHDVARAPPRRPPAGARRGAPRRAGRRPHRDQHVPSRPLRRPTGCSRSSPRSRPIDAARFPTPDEMERELAAAGFPHVEMRRLTAENELSREEALARIRGRHISTFDLLDAEEIAEGTARAERELPRARRHAARPAGRRRHGAR